MEAQEEDEEDPLLTPKFARPKIVLLIYSVVETLERGEAKDLLPDLETPKTAQSFARVLHDCGYEVILSPVRKEIDLIETLSKVRTENTLVFNLCESLGGTAWGELQVPRILERCGFIYAGATAENLGACLNKGVAKSIFIQQRIPTAPYQIFESANDPIQIHLPAIVKPVSEDCSLGITPKSVVLNSEGLRKQVKRTLDTYKQPALVEEFLDGREFSVSIWGNEIAHILSISEMDYSDCKDISRHILTFSEKWTSDFFPSIDPAPINLTTRAKICKIATAAYRAMGCQDYARVDLRERKGKIYVLEVNPNPCLAEDSGFAKAARTAGYDFSQMADTLVRQAWQRAYKEMAIQYELRINSN
jgi:D-alanine-D-alanine ligase